MSTKQVILDRVRIVNKYFLNKILIHICGTRIGHFAILSHIGRKSGKTYRIPVISEPMENGFVFALTYGKKVDWYANVMAKGGCSLIWKRKEFHLVQPEMIEGEAGLSAFPAVFRPVLRMAKIQEFLKLSIQS
jgi:deazaflavin-dependent oxidoreductase (nitroreductase family)